MTRYSGIWPVAPTPFHDDGTLDLAELRTAALVETNAQNARSSHEREEAMISAATMSRERVVDEAERRILR